METRGEKNKSESVKPADAADGQTDAMEANSDGQRNVRDNMTDGQTGTGKTCVESSG